MKKRRYSGHDKHFGPFTLSKHNDQGWRPFGIMLDSDGNDDYGDSKGCNLKLHGFGHTLILELPQIIQPYREKHMAMSWDAATVARLGRDYYFEVFPREFGFTMSDKTLHVHYGPQTHDSTTTKNKVFFLPWLNWRFVRQSWYGPTGQHIETLWETSSREVKRAQWDWRYEFEKTLAKNRFEIEDYDGQRILVDTNIEEREWRFGTGAFAWLSLFRRPMIKRSLNIAFAVEVGPQKGSWKGGLMGTGIDMLPGELHEAAFRRYCEQEHRDKGGRYRIKFIGPAEREHTTDADCWCMPKVDYTDPVTGVSVFVHNRPN